MSETRACSDCRGAGWVPAVDASDHTGYEPCKTCQGTGRVWGVDLLRDADPCGACPDTLATCSAPTIGDEPMRAGEIPIEDVRQPTITPQNTRITTFLTPYSKTENGVSAEHLPTGTIAVAGEAQSQHKNRRLALQRLGDSVGAPVLKDEPPW